MAAPTDWVPVLNTTGDQIPAGGLMNVTGVDPDTGALQVARPDKDSGPAVCVNGMATIPANGTGQGTFDPRAVVAYDPADGVPAAGETWGAAPGSWLSKKNRPGWRILGGAGAGLVNAVRVVARTAVYLRITGLPAAGTADYPWVRVDETDPALADVTGATAFPDLGTTTLFPAREVGKNKWLGQWTKVRAELNASGDALLFSAGSVQYTGATAAAVGPRATGVAAVNVVPANGVAGATLAVDVYNPWNSNVPSGKAVVIAWVPDEARYVFVAVDC